MHTHIHSYSLDISSSVLNQEHFKLAVVTVDTIYVVIHLEIIMGSDVSIILEG